MWGKCPDNSTEPILKGCHQHKLTHPHKNLTHIHLYSANLFAINYTLKFLHSFVGVHFAERAAARLRGFEAHLGHEAGAGELAGHQRAELGHLRADAADLHDHPPLPAPWNLSRLKRGVQPKNGWDGFG